MVRIPGVAVVSLVLAMTPSALAEPIVNLYSSRHYDVDEQIYQEFTKQTGIKVQHVQIKEAPQLVERIKAEGAKGPADVILTVDVGNLWRADQSGILATGVVPSLDKVVPAELRHPEGKWYAISTRARVLVFHKERVKAEEIQNYQDLSAARWKKRILARSSHHVYNQSLVASFLHHDGIESTTHWVKAVASNLARKPEGGDTDQIKAVAAGIGDVAIVNSYYVARLLKSTKPEDQQLMSKIGVVFPNSNGRGTHINISGAAIARHAPNRENAVRLIEYLLSPAVQEIYAEINGEFPVVQVRLPDHLKKLGSFNADSASLASIGQKTPEAIRIMDQSEWR